MIRSPFVEFSTGRISSGIRIVRIFEELPVVVTPDQCNPFTDRHVRRAYLNRSFEIPKCENVFAAVQSVPPGNSASIPVQMLIDDTWDDDSASRVYHRDVVSIVSDNDSIRAYRDDAIATDKQCARGWVVIVHRNDARIDDRDIISADSPRTEDE
jgi:hypothetical protein